MFSEHASTKNLNSIRLIKNNWIYNGTGQASASKAVKET